jgi:hypothetical protein
MGINDKSFFCPLGVSLTNLALVGATLAFFSFFGWLFQSGFSFFYPLPLASFFNWLFDGAFASSSPSFDSGREALSAAMAVR